MWEPQCLTTLSTSMASYMDNFTFHSIIIQKTNSMVLVCKRTIPTFADRGCRMVSTTDPHSHILVFLDRSRYYFFQVAPQLYLRGWVDSVPDPLLLRKSGSTWNWTQDLWICSQELWPLDHRGSIIIQLIKFVHANGFCILALFIPNYIFWTGCIVYYNIHDHRDYVQIFIEIPFQLLQSIIISSI
jgi:hypothetical protein